MSNKRKRYSDAQNALLLSEVGRVCPLCGEPLFYKKKSRSYKAYEIAHIFPLNPTAKEEKELEGVELLFSENVNDEENVIPLCDGCHGKFDNPRTREEYEMLFEIKRKILTQNYNTTLFLQYSIEEQINSVINELVESLDLDPFENVDYEIKKIDKKNDGTLNPLTLRKVRNNVSEYFLYVQRSFSRLDLATPDVAEIISLQIKAFYKKQKQQNPNQQEIFENLVNWLVHRTSNADRDACEIIISFFIQNCEVFE